MPSTLSRYSTPFITGLFLVSLVSGIALFFHWGTGMFHGVHEWLSMVLILPFILHIWKNWRPFVAYFKRLPMALALIISIVASLPFMFPSKSNSGGNPLVAVAMSVQNGSVPTVADLYGLAPDVLAGELVTAGYTVTSPEQTLADIAKASGKNSRDMINFLSGLSQKNLSPS
ncbi:DUF4405 domain-containing protein [Roseibium algae]|uniref:DUF4405 domain-containing protein n=1 Tax=Roseibium algae TaxID=3123038 RepID=A0ABU8THP3_9HYPH